MSVLLSHKQSEVLWLPKTGIYQESVNGEMRQKISGPFIVMDKQNANIRNYPSEYTNPRVEEYINEWVKPGRALGEYTHPGTPRVDPRNACIGIETLTLDSDNSMWHGKARVLTKTPPGAALAGLLEEGIPVGVSSRMLGREDKSNGDIIVVKVVTAADVVLDPSNSEAMVQVFMEHKDSIIETNYLLEEGFDAWERMLSDRGSSAIDDFLKGFLDRVWSAF